MRTALLTAGLAVAWLAVTYLGLHRALSLPVEAVLPLGFALLAGPVLYYLRRRDLPRTAAAERTARHARDRLDLLLDHLPAMLWTVDRDLRFTAARGKGLEDLGLRGDDLVGNTIAQLFGRDDEGFHPLEAYREALGGRAGSFSVDWSGRRWEVWLEPLWEGLEVVGVSAVGMDVTEGLETARRLEEQRAHLRKLFDESPEGIVLVDQSDRVLDVNAEFQRMFGYSRSEIVGRLVNDLIVPEGRFAEAVGLTRRVAAGEKIETEAVRRRKDGSLLDVSILATPVDLDQERRIFGIYRDITRQKAVELQLLHSQRLEAVGQLAGGVAHDFNNILTVILGQSHALLERVEDEELQSDLHQIETAAARAADLTRQLLTFSRRDVVSARPVNLDEVITDTREFLHRIIGEQVELTTELAGDLPSVMADPGQLQQVVMNLVINARDAMPGGGRVVVRTRRQPGGGPGSGKRTAGTEVVLLEVEDTGRGMAPEEAARIFEPFFTTKPAGQGTGLGMSTVYGIVERAGGSIQVDTEPGAGTAFRIRFPSAAEEAEAKEDEPLPDAAEAPADGGRGLILLVDDDAPVLDVARRILEGRGHRVVTADSGPSALRQVDEMDRPPDLLLTDIVMPEMSGRRLAEGLRQRCPGVRVLFMTGYTDGQWAREYELRPDGAMDIIQKPFDPNTLIRRVREALAEG